MDHGIKAKSSLVSKMQLLKHHLPFDMLLNSTHHFWGELARSPCNICTLMVDWTTALPMLVCSSP